MVKAGFKKGSRVKSKGMYSMPDMLPGDPTTSEVCRKVRGMALAYSEKTGLDPEDLYQTGMCGIMTKVRDTDGIGHMIYHARWAIRQAVVDAKVQKDIKNRYAADYFMLRKSSRTFEGLDSYLDKLPESRNKRALELYLQNESLSSIMRQIGMHTTNDTKRVIEKAVTELSKLMGFHVDLPCLWQKPEPEYPVGVTYQRGKFLARICKDGGAINVGVFDTVAEAKAARDAYIQKHLSS